MNIFKFVTLSNNEKAQKVWQGKFVATRQEQSFKVLLYRLDEFWVEVYYDKKTCTIKEFTPFVSKYPLNQYLNNIDISQAFSNCKVPIQFTFTKSLFLN